MKRIPTLLCTVLTALAIGGCARQPQAPKVLVACFSATGTTQAVADQLAATLSADQLAIRPATPYTEADLDWRNPESRSSLEMADPAARPALAAFDVDPADYDVIFIGFPIWWYTAPRIIDSFLESCDLTGKTVIPFATSGSSTIEQSCADLQQRYPTMNWVAGKRFEAVVSPEACAAWIEQINEIIRR